MRDERVGRGTDVQTKIAHNTGGHEVLGLDVAVHSGLVLGLVDTVSAPVPAVTQAHNATLYF